MRIEKELSLVNQAIVGFNDEKKSFMLGMIQARVGTGHQYTIKWSNGTINDQKEEHLFGAFTRRDQHRKDNYVLAMDTEDDLYKLAKTIAVFKDDKRLTVQFIPLNRTEEYPLDR